MKRKETPRARQMRLRESMKETALWGLFVATPILMGLHWLIVGY